MPGAVQVVRESRRSRSRPSERALASLLQNAHALSDGLQSQDGRRFWVVYPGRLSSRAGPDFRDSVIATETGELLTGDIELHLDASDWNSHRHHLDPNYNGVILHVALSPRAVESSPQQSRTRAPVVSLEPVMEELTRAKRPAVTVVDRLKGLGQTGLEGLLDHAGDQRFYARSRGFAMGLDSGDPDEALYGALMEGLGYASNRKPFRELSRIVTFESLRALRHEPGSTRLPAVKATLVRAAGLLDHVEPPCKAARLTALLTHLPRTRVMDAGNWRLFRVRPANHPVRRLAGAAHLMDGFIETGLVLGLENEVSRGDLRALLRRLTVTPFIGSGRASELAVSVVLPFMYAWAGLRRERSLQRRSLELYRRSPGPAGNEITREMKRLLSPEIEAVSTTGARRHQGLIHLYRAIAGRVST